MSHVALLVAAVACSKNPGAIPASDAPGKPPAAAFKAGTARPPRFNVLAIGQLVSDGQPEFHAAFVRAATTWLTALAAQDNFAFTSVTDPNAITDDVLARYELILQLNYTPFNWTDTAEAAFQRFMAAGRGGWVGLHHAGMYGPEVQPAGQAPWAWYYDFIGRIHFQDYIAAFASARVDVEEPAHPIFAGVPSSFIVTTDEWYVWDRSPRPFVHVLAHVDESTYVPASSLKMNGDHPVIWTNESYATRNLYIFMGHHPNLFENTAYTQLLKNAIFWAAGRPAP